jgi:hypothetical protein
MPTIMNTHTRMKQQSAEQEVYRSVQRRLNECPYAFIFSKVTCHFDEGRLTLCGSVPSFYLKQVLQERLRHIEHVTQIRNEVEVVSSTGLSSVPPRKPR